LLLLLQSTVLEFAPVHVVTPCIGLLVALHVGLSEKWTPSSAALVAFCTGYLFDLVAGVPRGVHAFVFVLMCLFARALAARLAVRGLVFKAATAFAASLLTAVLVVVIRAQVSIEGGFAGLRQAPAEALLDDSIRFAGAAGAAEVPVRLEVWPEMLHVWHFFHPLLGEGRRAIAEAGAFVRQHMVG